MGSLVSKKKSPANLVMIAFNKPVFMAGENLTGYVQLEIAEVLAVRALMLTFNGSENVIFRDQKSKNATKGSGPIRHLNEKIILYDFKLHEYPPGTKLEPGTYKYPFSVGTPDWLPESLYISPVAESTF